VSTIEVKLCSLMVAPLLGAFPLHSSAPSYSSQSPGPCSSAEYHQFDFWIGNWQVSTPDGKRAGANTIERALDGCVLHESWRGASGSRGNSYNIYDASRKQWHQTWVNDRGELLQLDGGLQDGRMVLAGETIDTAGKRIEHRITWSQVGKERVRQLWESSSDGGRTWSVTFDGLYVRSHP
jgi:hypothetical protein